MSNILVTGASGFVGTALCAELERRSITCTAAVRKASNPAQLAVGELSATTDWSQALAGCDAVIHLAARVHVMNDTSDDPLTAFRAVNVAASVHLARQAAQHGVKRFVFVSSVKVNGEATGTRPFTAFDAGAPQDPYGQSKLEAELALKEVALATGLELVIVRPPLVYGPGVRANFMRLMQLAKIGLPLPLGAIHNQRSMVALDNLVDLLILCCRHPAAPGQTFMVSDDHDVSIGELLRMLASGMGKRTWLMPVPAGLIQRCAALLGKKAVADRLLGSLQVDIAHTKATLGWKPVPDIQESINKTVAHFLKQ
ncbi:SDR family oxidoreductase [Janthinobacterium sp. GW460P]|uniref:UDP-glucose 4-epimerase family protein n=1 Tax=unclassified Janthinobacterium TaxID=2610881 RepID=UPI000A3261F9|nr:MULTISPECIES: SDR family oxidoreductase [unclassified Janthinobacterium]MCC7701834.1 SDR family oxidoreductase [Janthinobacterium sp. GW460P]MCC7707342.1 SDR family oxidoreductase [Janthinobacterium sp. GW460W]